MESALFFLINNQIWHMAGSQNNCLTYTNRNTLNLRIMPCSICYSNLHEHRNKNYYLFIFYLNIFMNNDFLMGVSLWCLRHLFSQFPFLYKLTWHTRNKKFQPTYEILKNSLEEDCCQNRLIVKGKRTSQALYDHKVVSWWTCFLSRPIIWKSNDLINKRWRNLIGQAISEEGRLMTFWVGTRLQDRI